VSPAADSDISADFADLTYRELRDGMDEIEIELGLPPRRCMPRGGRMTAAFRSLVPPDQTMGQQLLEGWCERASRQTRRSQIREQPNNVHEKQTGAEMQMRCSVRTNRG
jgi:hypothetical protein